MDKMHRIKWSNLRIPCAFMTDKSKMKYIHILEYSHPEAYQEMHTVAKRYPRSHETYLQNAISKQ